MILSARRKLIINESKSLEKALKMIQKNNQKILFVTNRENKLIGSLTDGDVRRALIKNIKVKKISDIMNKNPFSVNQDTKSIDKKNKTPLIET